MTAYEIALAAIFGVHVLALGALAIACREYAEPGRHVAQPIAAAFRRAWWALLIRAAAAYDMLRPPVPIGAAS